MRIAGNRSKRTRLIQRGKYVVEIEVEMVTPIDDPDELCYESETVAFLKEVADRAERGDLSWLQRHGKVFELIEAT